MREFITSVGKVTASLLIVGLIIALKIWLALSAKTAALLFIGALVFVASTPAQAS
jgi:hypothetical protein